MTVEARYYTDPACPWSWNAEPAVRKLMVEFGDNLSWTYVMGGLARDYTNTLEARARRILEWLDVADRGGMPLGPRLWQGSPVRAFLPAGLGGEGPGPAGAGA